MAGTGGSHLGPNQDPPTHFLDPVLNWNFPDGIASVQIMLHIVIPSQMEAAPQRTQKL